MKKRILSFAAAIVMFMGTVNSGFAVYESTPVALSPRASVEIVDRQICGITDPVTVEWLKSQFCGEVSVTSKDGITIADNKNVPTDSSVSTEEGIVGTVVIGGDANRDGNVTILDASVTLKSIAGWGNDISRDAADVDGNDIVSLSDVSDVLKYIVGWDITLAERAMLHVSFDEYVLLSSDPETDDAVVEGVKALLGKDVTVVSEVTEGMKYITVDMDLWNKYEFMDGVRLRSLFPENSYVDTYGGNIYLTACGKDGLDGCVNYLSSADELLIPKGYTGTVGHLTGESKLLYDEAVQRILSSGDGSDGIITDDVYTALVNAEWTEPKNIIYMIGDGMSVGALTSAEVLHGSDMYGGILSMKYLPVKGVSTTFSYNDQYTDSAAGGTALATGYKTTEGTVAMDPAHTTDYRSLTEVAKSLDKSTGIVATCSIVDATPATFSVHTEDRLAYSEIARQQLSAVADGKVDLIFGGGYDTYEVDDVRETIDYAVGAGVTYTKDFDTARNAELPVVGLFAPYGILGNGKNEPSLAEMTATALEKLSENENGFFLMVEGSEIDSYGHDNMLREEAWHVYEFDRAVAVAMRYAALHPDTAVIVTADHETGGLSVPPDATPETIDSVYRYFMGRHHWINVPVYAVGCGTGELSGLVDNTHIARFAAGLMGEEDFGHGSVIKTLFDLGDASVREAFASEDPDAQIKDECGIYMRFGGANPELTLPMDYIFADESEYADARVVNVTYHNVGETTVNLPGLRVVYSGNEYRIRDWCIFIEPDETYTMSYVLPVELIGDGKLTAADHVGIYGSSSAVADLCITDIVVTCYNAEE